MDSRLFAALKLGVFAKLYKLFRKVFKVYLFKLKNVKNVFFSLQMNKSGAKTIFRIHAIFFLFCFVALDDKSLFNV